MLILEIIFFVLICLGFLAWVSYLRHRENRYLKKRTREALSKKLHEEIQKEREENIRKSDKFKEILTRFGGEK